MERAVLLHLQVQQASPGQEQFHTSRRDAPLAMQSCSAVRHSPWHSNSTEAIFPSLKLNLKKAYSVVTEENEDTKGGRKESF